jgi:hypothetical protein
MEKEIKKECECKHPKPSLKNSENGIYCYCLKCYNHYKPKRNEK